MVSMVPKRNIPVATPKTVRLSGSVTNNIFESNSYEIKCSHISRSGLVISLPFSISRHLVAFCAAFGSCVTIKMVLFSFADNSSSRLRISSAESLSKSPVGSSATISDG